MERLGHDDLFMGIAVLVSQRSTCLRGHTGAVIVQDRRPVSIGYNGAPAGTRHCTEVGCEPYMPERSGTRYDDVVQQALSIHGCQRTIHAEMNAILWAARRGILVEEAAMYCVSAPCLRCAQAIIAAGIIEVVWKNDYRAKRLDLLDKACVKVRRHVA